VGVTIYCFVRSRKMSNAYKALENKYYQDIRQTPDTEEAIELEQENRELDKNEEEKK